MADLPKKFAYLVVLIFVSYNIQEVYPASTKCDQVVSIESTELLSYLGNVTFIAPGPVVGTWTLAMKTSIPFTFIGGWHVMISSTPAKGQALFQNVDTVNIHAGDKVSFRFRIHYGSRSQVPKVKGIKWEKWTICGDALYSVNADLIKQSALKSLDLEASSEVVEGNEVGSGFESDNAFRRRKTDSPK